MKRIRIPIRFKLLSAVLVMILAVVSLITFTMANLFHTDKTAYIHDITSMMALHTAEEARSLAEGYQERLKVLAVVMADQTLDEKQRTQLLNNLFGDFNDLAAVTLYEGEIEQITVHDAATLEAAGITISDLKKFRVDHPLPFNSILKGEAFVENTAIPQKISFLSLAAVHHDRDGAPPVVVLGTLRLDSLVRLAKRSEVFDTFLIDGKGGLLVQRDMDLAAQGAQVDWLPDLETLQKGKSLVTTAEYAQNGVAMIGGFALVDVGGMLVGIQIPKAAAFLTARALLNNLIWVSLALVATAAVLSLIWSYRLTRPIEKLSEATRELGKGQFNISVEVSSRDEIGDLASSFNQMAVELNTRDKELNQAHAALVQSEKMSAFGQLSAGIAHEVKNPLAGILGYAQLSLRKVEEDSPLHKNLAMIEKETRRCKNIIENLMKFARQEKVEMEPVDINSVVEDAIAIVDHQLGINRVKVEKVLSPDVPRFLGNGNQIQQVLMNFMINAQQAMDGQPGTVRVMTKKLGGRKIEVRVSDTGPGIPKEIQAKIFEPFFTTKPAGKGTGLGLSVTFGIIRDHNGEIRLESKPGEGATFIITLPVV